MFRFTDQPPICEGEKAPAFPAFRFDAGQAVYEEAVIGQNYVGVCYSALGAPAKRATEWARVQAAHSGLSTMYQRRLLRAFELEVDGRTLLDCWVLDRVEQPQPELSRIQLSCTAAPLRVTVCTRTDETEFIERWLEIENSGDRPLTISRLAPFSGILMQDQTGIKTPDHHAFLLGSYHNRNWLLEGDFRWEELPIGTLSRRSDRMIRFSPEFYAVKDSESGATLLLDFEYMGGCRVSFTRQNERYFSATDNGWRGDYLHISCELYGNAPLRVLAPGETVTSPRVHMGLLYGNWDEIVNRRFQHLRAGILPLCPPQKHYVEYNYFAYTDCLQTSSAIVRSQIDVAAAAGCELFMLDAGWNGSCGPEGNYAIVFGDYLTENPNIQDLPQVFDYAREKGLKVGIWLAFEAVGSQSEILKDHPDFVAMDGEESCYLLNLADDRVKEYAFSMLCQVIERYRLDILRIDGGHHPHAVPWTAEGNPLWEYVDHFYEIFDRLREKYPGLVLENCWGGGGRIGTGIMRRFHWTQISDNNHPEDQLRILNGLTNCLLPEQCMGFTQPFSHMADARFVLRAVMMGHLTLVGAAPTLDGAHETYLALCREQVALYKTRLRPILVGGRVYHHTPGDPLFADSDWVVLEQTKPDKTEGFAGLFRLHKGEDTFLLRPRGLSRAKTYEIWFDNEQEACCIPGWRLMEEGLQVRLEAPLTSQLLLFRAV